MSWATGLMVYLVIWWTVLFAVLPLGVRKLKNPGKGEERGAPERPDLVRKAIITSIVAAVLWIAFYFLHQSDISASGRWSNSPTMTPGTGLGLKCAWCPLVLR